MLFLFWKTTRAGREGFVDRLHCRYTVRMLLLMTTFLVLWFLLAEKISCWSPSHFTGAHHMFTQSVCWMSSTFHLPFADTIPRHNSTDLFAQNAYYQWTPLILAGMALLFCIPHCLWILACKIPTYSAVAITDACVESEKFSKGSIDVTEKRKLLAYVGDRLGGVLQKPRHNVTGGNSGLWLLIWQVDCWYMTIAYLSVKVLYLSNVIIQWVLLEIFLSGFKDEMYSLKALDRLFKTKNWLFATSYRFPLMILCEYQIRRLGNVQRYTVQCTISVNLINQCFFLLVCLWFFVLSFVTLCSLLKWVHIVVDSVSRERYIVGRLQAMARSEPGITTLDPTVARAFARNFITADCYLAIRLVACNTSDATVAELIHNLWRYYLKECASYQQQQPQQVTHQGSQQPRAYAASNPRPGMAASAPSPAYHQQCRQAPGAELKHRQAAPDPLLPKQQGSTDPSTMEMSPITVKNNY